MCTAAALPALALLAGSALGFLAPDVPTWIHYVYLVGGAGGAIWAWARSATAALVVSVIAAFSAGGALLAADAWHHAWQPSLRIAFDKMVQAERDQAAAERRPLPEEIGVFAIVSGTLRTDAARTESGVSLSIDVDRLGPADRPVTGGVNVTVVGALAAERIGRWRAGRRLRAPVELRRPSRYLDPGVPNHERELARRGTILVGTVKSGALVEVLAPGGRLDEGMAAGRAFARQAIETSVGRWSARSAAIVSAIVIGDRTGLEPEVQRRLQEAGTYHVIAISGGNIAILAGLMLGAFRLFGLLGRIATVAAICVLVGYGEFVGGGASVDRATLMAVVYLAGRLIDQRNPPLNTLAFVAGCLVATAPLSVVDPAFVLTFGATLGIIVVVPIVARAPAAGGRTEGTHRALGCAVTALVSMFAASAAAEAVLFPVSAFVFARVTVAGLALNFVAIPLMAIAQIAGMAIAPIALVSDRAALAFGYVAHLGAAGLVWAAELVRFVPALTWRVAAPNMFAVGAYYAAAITWWSLWRRRSRLTGSTESRFARQVRRAAAIGATAAALWIVAEPWAVWTTRGDGRLHVMCLDVGQGDATLIRFPRGRTLLVDAGGLSGSFDVGDRVVAPVLRRAGIRRLDYLVLTHGDPDHIGGALSIVREFRPRNIWEGIPVPPFELLRALHDEARARNLQWSNVKTGDRLMLDGVETIVRHPGEADWERQRVRNDDSVVLELRWRDVSMLLTGDVGAADERSIAATLRPAPLRAMKVGHHGSLTSSAPEFVRAAAPRIAIVSVGRANHFGHPATDVLDRYRAVGAEIFRTDRDGAVTLDTDGTTIDVETFAGRRLELRATS